MSRFINCMILNNEVWAVALRLAYEYDFYDRFILTEARTTFSGQAKPLYFERYRNQIEDPEGKIIYQALDTLPYEADVEYATAAGQRVIGNRWPAEHFMRNAARSELARLKLGPEDVVVVQDVDEIGNIEAIASKAPDLGPRHVHRLVYADYRETVQRGGLKPDPWEGGYMMRGTLAGEDLHDLRRLHVNGRTGALQHWHIQSPMFIQKPDGAPMYDLIERPDLTFSRARLTGDAPGWHLSGMSGGFPKFRMHKRNAFAHAEVDRPDRVSISQDFWAEVQAYCRRRELRRPYDRKAVDPRLPDFIRERIKDFPILLNR